MVKNEFTPLETFREIFLDGFFDHSWACKTNQGSGLCNIKITKHSK